MSRRLDVVSEEYCDDHMQINLRISPRQQGLQHLHNQVTTVLEAVADYM